MKTVKDYFEEHKTIVTLQYDSTEVDVLECDDLERILTEDRNEIKAVIDEMNLKEMARKLVDKENEEFGSDSLGLAMELYTINEFMKIGKIILTELKNKLEMK